MPRSIYWLAVVSLVAGIGVSGCSSDADNPVVFAPLSNPPAIPDPSSPEDPTPGSTPQVPPASTPTPLTPVPTALPLPGSTATPAPGPTPAATPTPVGGAPSPTPTPLAGAVIQLTTTVPEQSAGRFQISVQIPPAQLTTPSFTIPPLDPSDPEVEFQRTSLEIFAGFTSYATALESSFTLVEFSQLQIEGVTNADCVIVHVPIQSPLDPAGQIAVSQGCS